MRSKIITALMGIKRCINKHVNYERVREVMQGKEDSPAASPSRLVEAFHKSMNSVLTPEEGQVPVGQRFSLSFSPS